MKTNLEKAIHKSVENVLKRFQHDVKENEEKEKKATP
jgi:hypothetical protein